jgi:uncharacterized membrane protein YjfL (UPF0719 family)
VRDDLFYLGFYLLLGAAWVGGATFFFSLMGVSARDDVVERRNLSASWAICGALVGTTLCFAGANVGSGPGVHVVLLCALLTTAAFFLLWLSLELLVDPSPSDSITIERNPGAGIRLGGYLA